MKIVNYDKTTGKILGWYDSEIHSTIPTPNAEVTDSEWHSAINNNANYFDGTKCSIKDFRTFAELQQTKLQEIYTAYSNATQLDIAYLGTTFDTKQSTQDVIAKNLSIGSVPAGFYFRDINNVDVPMTYTELQGFGAAIQTRDLANFSKFQSLKASVLSATTQAELDAIVW